MCFAGRPAKEGCPACALGPQKRAHGACVKRVRRFQSSLAPWLRSAGTKGPGTEQVLIRIYKAQPGFQNGPKPLEVRIERSAPDLVAPSRDFLPYRHRGGSVEPPPGPGAQVTAQ